MKHGSSKGAFVVIISYIDVWLIIVGLHFTELWIRTYIFKWTSFNQVDIINDKIHIFKCTR